MWEKRYQIGIVQIDQQHKQLFGAVENLLKALNTAPWDKAQAKKAVDYLKSFIVIHFGTEEIIQQEMGFAEAEIHREMHRKLIDRLHQLELDLIRSSYDIIPARRLANTLASWLMYHVIREDRKMAAAGEE